MLYALAITIGFVFSFAYYFRFLFWVSDNYPKNSKLITCVATLAFATFWVWFPHWLRS